MKEINYILGLDVSTKTIGIALFEDLGDKGKVKLLHHVSPTVKPKPEKKATELFEKVNIFEEDFLKKYSNIGIKRVIIEEPLLGSNNVHTVATLLRFNGMISKSCYNILGVSPDFISSYDSRMNAFPELMSVRRFKKNGEALTEKQISKNLPVLFGGYPFDIDKKCVIWEKVSDLEPQIVWLYDKNKKLKKENYDTSDAYACVIGFMRQQNFWK